MGIESRVPNDVESQDHHGASMGGCLSKGDSEISWSRRRTCTVIIITTKRYCLQYIAIVIAYIWELVYIISLS